MFTTLSDFITYSTSFFNNGPFWAVAIPSIICLFILIKKQFILKDKSLWALILTCCVLATIAGVWNVSEETISLHMPPTFLVALAGAAWCGYTPCVSVAYFSAFLSLLGADITNAIFRFESTHQSFNYLSGVGGAGIFDGLFIFPILTAILVLYINWRKLKSYKH